MESRWALTGSLCFLLCGQAAMAQEPADDSYMEVRIDKTFEEVQEADVRDKPKVMSAQSSLLAERYDLDDAPTKRMMSGGRRAVQGGIRVKLHGGV